jgi:DNA modification methylase
LIKFNTVHNLDGITLASETLNRKWLGFEINKEYIEKANKRLQEFK